MKKILVIGGTQMIGRDFVEYAIQNPKNYEIYIANRNITNPNLFTCKHIKIDRNSPEQCKSLAKHGEFDVVVDFSCYNSHQLYNVLSHLKYKKYYLISTCSVTDNQILNNKSHSLYEYAKGKLEIERYINTTELKHTICIVRPPVVYGEHDYTNRFYKNGDNFYYKDTKKIVHNDINHIYVRDFTKKLLKNIEHNTQGTITITGCDFQIHPQESKYIHKQKFDQPFNHIVIDNLFDNSTYKEMCDMFPAFVDGILPYKDLPQATSDYEGIIAGLSLNRLTGGYQFFASKYLQNFIEQEFEIKTTKFIAPSAHFHKPPSKDGFVHRDYNIVSFMDRDEEFVDMQGCLYTDDTISNPNTTKVIRSIALLYYLDNDDSTSAIGGGTGIYATQEKNKPIKVIEPKNNRLLIFEITHNSYHGFIGANFPRSCIVSWFHSEPSYMIERHKDLGGKKLIERWSLGNPENYWEIN